MSKLEMVECPEHGGGFDCTPFCKTCEGEQGYYPSTTQHHYVVCFDTETGKWNIENETRYFDGTVYDTATNEWTHAIDNDANYAKDEELYDTLNAVLLELNGEKTK